MNVLECYQRKRELVFEDDVVALCRSVLVIFVLIYRNLARGPFAKVLRDIIGTKTELLQRALQNRCSHASPAFRHCLSQKTRKRLVVPFSLTSLAESRQ
jgi:hypothetical protein